MKRCSIWVTFESMNLLFSLVKAQTKSKAGLALIRAFLQLRQHRFVVPQVHWGLVPALLSN